jgi:predicted lipoprotein
VKPATFVLRLWQRPDGLRLELMTPQGEREVFRDFEALVGYLKRLLTPQGVLESQKTRE